MDVLVEVSSVSKRFGRVAAVDRASLSIAPGELVAVLGPSGCGKTTLLRLIAGFEAPDSGTIRIRGSLVAGDGAWVAPERRKVGMVFQDYALFPHLSVAENVGFGLPRRRRQPRVAELLSLVGLDGLAHRYPHQLSGGEQQRVALARALAPEPELILLDEPWSNVDPHLRSTLRREVVAVLEQLGLTALLVTHDREEALSLAHRVALMREGSFVQVGSPEDLYFAPLCRWAAEFVGPANFLSGTVSRGVVHTAVGELAANGAREGDQVEVLLRPEQIELQADADGQARVVEREFRGHDVVYRVRIDGLDLVSQRPSTEILEVGSAVSVRVHGVALRRA